MLRPAAGRCTLTLVRERGYDDTFPLVGERACDARLSLVREGKFDDSLWASPWTGAANVSETVNPRTSLGSRQSGCVLWISQFQSNRCHPHPAFAKGFTRFEKTLQANQPQKSDDYQVARQHNSNLQLS